MLFGFWNAVRASCREMTASCQVACSTKHCPAQRPSSPIFMLKTRLLHLRNLSFFPFLQQVCPPSPSFTTSWCSFLFRQRHCFAAARSSQSFSESASAQKERVASSVHPHRAKEIKYAGAGAPAQSPGSDRLRLSHQAEPTSSESQSNGAFPQGSEHSVFARNGSLAPISDLLVQKGVSESSTQSAAPHSLPSRASRAESVAAVRRPIRSKALSPADRRPEGSLTNSFEQPAQASQGFIDRRAEHTQLSSNILGASKAADVELGHIPDKAPQAPWVMDLPGWLKSVKSLPAEKRPRPMVIAFDIETTGFSRTTDRIVEFAARDAEGGDQGEIHSLIYPGDGQSVGASRTVHGISNEMLHPSLPMWSDFFPRLCAWVASRNTAARPVLFVAHNGKRFDVPFVAWECARAGFEMPLDWLFVDSLYIAEEHVESTSTKLQVLKDHFGIQSSAAAHRAPADVDVTLHVLSNILQRKHLRVGNLYDFIWAFGVKNERKHVWGLSTEDATRFQALLSETKQKRLRQEAMGVARGVDFDRKAFGGASRSKLNGAAASGHRAVGRRVERRESGAAESKLSLPSNVEPGGSPDPVCEPSTAGDSRIEEALSKEASEREAEETKEIATREVDGGTQKDSLLKNGPSPKIVSKHEPLSEPSSQQSQRGVAQSVQLPLFTATRVPPLRRPVGRTAGEEKQAALGSTGPAAAPSKEPALCGSRSLPPLSRISRAQELGARIDQLRTTATKDAADKGQASGSGKEKEVRLFVRGPVAMIRADMATPSETDLEGDVPEARPPVPPSPGTASTTAAKTPSVVRKPSPPLHPTPEQQTAASAPEREDTGTTHPLQQGGLAQISNPMEDIVKEGSTDLAARLSPKAWSLQQRLEALKQRISGQEKHL